MRWRALILLLIAGPAWGVNISQSDIPFLATAGTSYTVTQDLSHDGSGASAIAIRLPAGAGCTVDMGGHTLTLTGTATHGIQASNSSGTATIFNGIIDKQNTTAGQCIQSASGASMLLHHIKATTATTGANDYCVRWQGANGGAEDCLFIRTVTGTVAAFGASGGWNLYNNTFVHTGTTGNAVNIASTSGTMTIANNIFRCAGAATVIQCTAVSGPTITFASNIYYRSNNGTVVTYPSGTNYVNGGAGTNVTSLDANAGVADPNLTGSWVIQSSSVGIIDNGTTGYTYSTDLAGSTRVANGTIDRGAYELQDTTAPSAVSDLAAGSVTTTSVALFWTAPGDDAGSGTATTYDVRYSTSTINAGNFSSATAATGEPSPGAAGHAETFTVTGLSAATTYYFAVKTSDEVPNTSAISNVVSKATASATGRVAAGSFGIDFLEPEEE